MQGYIYAGSLHGKPSMAASAIAHEHRAWLADLHQVVFSDESRFNMWDHDGRIRVREVLHPKVVPFLQCIIGAIFQQDNARLHVAKTVRDYCSSQHMPIFPWPAQSTDMSPNVHAWDLIGLRLAREPCFSDPCIFFTI
ncbi:transposable element Tc1 transposase [Trichonephila clavipes]|nr:transposable element Tc1 transposase [Trichonephila clavipes]